MTPEQQELFIAFVTGSAKLPIGGFSKLTPNFSVSERYVFEGKSPNNDLPTARTCSNMLNLPPYTTKEILKDRLLLAITEGQGHFDLS